MVIRIEEFNGNLASRPPAALKVDRDVMRTQVVSCSDNLIERGNLESNMMQLQIFRLPLGCANQGNTVMIGNSAEKDHSTRHQFFWIDVRDFKAEDLGIKGQ